MYNHAHECVGACAIVHVPDAHISLLPTHSTSSSTYLSTFYFKFLKLPTQNKRSRRLCHLCSYNKNEGNHGGIDNECRCERRCTHGRRGEVRRQERVHERLALRGILESIRRMSKGAATRGVRKREQQECSEWCLWEFAPCTSRERCPAFLRAGAPLGGI